MKSSQCANGDPLRRLSISARDQAASLARTALAAAMAWRCCRFSMAAGPSTSDILNFANIDTGSNLEAV
jgi:hypothetical protein